MPQHLQLHLYATYLLIRILSHSIFNHLSISIPSEIDQRSCYKTNPRQSAAPIRAAAELLLLSPVWVARDVRVILVGEGQALVMRMTAAAAHPLHSLGHFTILQIPFNCHMSLTCIIIINTSRHGIIILMFSFQLHRMCLTLILDTFIPRNTMADGFNHSIFLGFLMTVTTFKKSSMWLE